MPIQFPRLSIPFLLMCSRAKGNNATDESKSTKKKDASESNDDVAELEFLPSSGPDRFDYRKGQRSIDDQIASLSEQQRECVENLKKRWEAENPDLPFSSEMYLRFARNSPGQRTFNEKASWVTMKNFDHRFLSLTAEALEEQLSTKVGN